MHRAWRAADQRGELAACARGREWLQCAAAADHQRDHDCAEYAAGQGAHQIDQENGGYPRRGGIPGEAADDEAGGEADHHNSQQDAPRDGRDMAWIADVANTCRVARADALIWCKRRPSFQPARE